MITLLWTTKKESAKDITYLPSCIVSNARSKKFPTGILKGGYVCLIDDIKPFVKKSSTKPKGHKIDDTESCPKKNR